jgi:hypothetical protein
VFASIGMLRLTCLCCMLHVASYMFVLHAACCVLHGVCRMLHAACCRARCAMFSVGRGGQSAATQRSAEGREHKGATRTRTRSLAHAHTQTRTRTHTPAADAAPRHTVLPWTGALHCAD